MFHRAEEISSSGAAGARPFQAGDPIGVFDSGVGGLTVARELLKRLPFERITYIADQANVPYGGRPLDQVKSLATRLTQHLFASGAKAVVMACNISSATALEDARARFGADRVFGMIEPGAAAAIDETRSGKIGVLATRGTVDSGAYTRALRSIAPFVSVTEVACPRFVPLVEAGRVDSEEARDAAREYLAPILAAGADTVILGCTHYPFLQETLARVAGAQVAFVDPARAVVLRLREALSANALLARETPQRPHSMLTTGDRALFAAQLEATWPSPEHLAWATIDSAAAPAAK